MKRFLLPLTLVVALVVPACSVVRPYAARVNGEEISQRAVEDELTTILDNDRYMESLRSGGEIAGQGKNTFTTAFVARLLTVRVLLELVHQAFVRRDLKITDPVLQLAQADVVDQVGGREVLASFPDEYRRQLVQRTAEVTALQLDLADVSVDDAAVRDFYDENAEELFGTTCISHILVSVNAPGGRPDPSQVEAQAPALEAEAAALRAKIAGGADFAAVATESSDDPGTASEGGDLGCGRPGRYVPEFEDAASKLAVGEVSQPVRTQFGFHLIKVADRRAEPLEDVRTEVRQRIVAQAQNQLSQFLGRSLGEAKIAVNPRYGRFDRSGAQPQIVPPQAPTGPGQRQRQPGPSPVPEPLP